jgi:hypothetical protein
LVAAIAVQYIVEGVKQIYLTILWSYNVVATIS